MQRGVLIGKQTTGDYGLVSTGDYINPIANTFKLKDTKKSLVQITELYLIINDISIEYAKIAVSGSMTTIRCFLSWNKVDWFSDIVTTEATDALEATVIKPFYVKVVVDDFLEYFKLTGETSYTNYKLKLIYT